MVKVAVLGFGTVGSGVAEVLDMNKEKIAKTVGQEVSVKYIVDIRDFTGSQYADLMTKDFGVVENDPEVKIVVETIGGATVAYDFTRRSLLAGKSVITSNKELVATHGYELLQIAKEKNVNYLFEASVGGGIPILRPITQCLAGNSISEVYGILNGTTNYILTQMIEEDMPFDTALKQAQANGYAEANPAADIEGADACRKTCILSALCFGNHVYPDAVPTEGITNVTLDDVSAADKFGYRIKLLGRAVKCEDGKIAAYVAPHLVSDKNIVSGVDDVMNAIVVKGNAVGETMFYGPGAGKLPTASAVVGDVIDAAQHLGERKQLDWDKDDPNLIADAEMLETRWYVRCGKDGLGLSDAAEIMLEKNEKAYLTPAMNKKDIEKLTDGKDVMSMFRVLD